MTASGISQILFSVILLISIAAFGGNSTKKVCNETKRQSPLQALLKDSKYLLSKTKESKAIQFLPRDPRTPKDRSAQPEYNPIGLVETEIGRGTGWLGNNCLVWTSKHVIGKHKNIIGKKVKFHVGHSDNPKKEFKYVIEGEVVESGNPEGGSDHPLQDWALIKLKKPIGKEIGFIEAAQYSVEDAKTCKTLEVAGFPGEKSNRLLWWQGNCPLFETTSGVDVFHLGCPLTKGNSGGPLLCREVDNKLYAIGIAQQSRSDRPDSETFILNFTADWDNAKPAFQKHNDLCEELKP